MSSSIRIGPGTAWAAPGWAFDLTLDDIAGAVERRDPSLAEAVRDGTTGRHAFGHLDLTSWGAEAMRLFLAGALEAKARRERAGERSFDDPSLLPLYMRLLSEPIDTLRSDSRTQGGARRLAKKGAGSTSFAGDTHQCI